MKIWVQKLFVLFLLVLLPSLSLASEIFFRNIEDKVYIQPDSIYFSANQMYVIIEEDLIPIQHLSCDQSGVFTYIEDIQTGRGRQNIWPCPKCGYENYEGIDNCGLCGRNRYAQDGL